MVEYCKVCGHVISSSESIARGYGSECNSAIIRAYYKLLKEDSDASLQYNWLIEVELVKSLYLKTFAKTKFRSEFKKSFFASMQTSERVSKKQMDIMRTELDYKQLGVGRDTLGNAKREFFESWCKGKKVTRKAIELARKDIRNKSNK